MDVLRLLMLALMLACLPGCYLGYIMESGYNQAKLLTQGQDFETVYKTPTTPEETKRKLKLIAETKSFAENQLGLSKNKNYTQFVQLDRPYVSYVVSAAEKSELKAKTWSFPIVGEVPYKGYFKEEDAKEEATALANKNYDVYVRGVSAYSTLGYFRDPVLSSMLNDDDHGIVSLILHETVHATLWIKNNASFNERLAVFLGNKGAIEFYRSKEGSVSPTSDVIQKEEADEADFSVFISNEITKIKTWYQENRSATEEARQARLQEIRWRFTTQLAPKLRTRNYSKFAERPLNNAHLVMYETYYGGLLDFDKIWKNQNQDFRKTLEKMKTLEKADDPIKKMSEL